MIAFTACKSKKNTASAASSATSTTSSSGNNPANSSSLVTATGNTSGKVSHQYRSAGCATVIICTQDGTELTLIPKEKLAKEFDVDGLEVQFNYHTLKMPQPAGCTVGMPAEITELSKK